MSIVSRVNTFTAILFVATVVAVAAADDDFASDKSCDKGQRLHTPKVGPDICLPCDLGSFMSKENHEHKQCNNCTQFNPQLEIVITDCNRTHDAAIVCKGGYFRRRAANPTEGDICEKCKACPDGLFQIRECQTYSDTACCPDKNHKLVGNGRGFPVCTMTHCGTGHYLNVTANKCFPCHPNTFMDEASHANRECDKCISIDPGSHVIVENKCNSTHPGTYQCEAGYYFTHAHPKSQPICEKCTHCKCTLKMCSTNSDTECCDATSVTVNTTPTPPTVTSTATPGHILCPNETFLNTSNQTCELCRIGTYMDEVNHTRTTCKNCSESNGTAISYKCKSENNREVHLTAVIICSVVYLGMIYCTYVCLKRTGALVRVKTFCHRFICRYKKKPVRNTNDDNVNEPLDTGETNIDSS